jgi:hypothetical protein
VLPPGSPSYQYGGYQYAAYGDKTLKWLIGETPTPGGWYAGKEFDRFFMDESEWAHPDPADTNVVDVLDNFAAQYPAWAAQGFEIAGFVWWQGDKDRYDMGHATRYEHNLVNLINSLRGYYTNRYPGKVASNAPFVLATLGQTAIGDTSSAADKAILDAQLAVDGDAGNYPQFAGNVKTVYAHPLSQGGASNSHYNSHALTYMLVGDALGRSMVDLIEASAGPDENPPVVVGLSPANGASGVSSGTSLAATFNESIAIGTGNITLRNLPDDGPSGDLVIDVTDASQVTVSGNILTVNPAANLATSTQYAVFIDATAIDDLAGNSYAGIADNTTWSFTTATPDTTAPTLSSTVPANGATVAADVNLVATFSEPIAIGSGGITLKNLTDGPGGDILIAVTDGSQVSVSGSVLTINPAADLLLGKDYAVRIDATAIDDLVGNSYAGISDDATWSFSTPAPPPVGVVFFDNFEAGSNPSALPATAGSYSNTPDVSAAQSTGNTSGAANTALWVRANQGFGASRCGLVDESAGAFADPAGEQAFAFRYTNSGLTTAFGVIGSLTAGTTYTVSFDVVADTAATPYNMQFVTFNGAGTRNDIRSDSFVSKVLASRSGNAPGDGSYQTVSIQFTPDAVLDAAVIGHDLAIRFKGATTSANIDNVSVTTIGPAGPGPVASFAISPIASPQTVGTPVTGLTITAKDAAGQTATSFTGTVTFGGSGGFTGTSASFTAGVLSGASVTPPTAGSNLTFTVRRRSPATPAAPPSPPSRHATTKPGRPAPPFDGDSNNDGVANGMAWLLGAGTPQAAAGGLLPTATRDGTALVFSFRCLKSSARGGTALHLQHSGDLGLAGPWTSTAVPETNDTLNGVSFVVTPDGDFNHVVATIPGGDPLAALFARLLAIE